MTYCGLGDCQGLLRTLATCYEVRNARETNVLWLFVSLLLLPCLLNVVNFFTHQESLPLLSSCELNSKEPQF